ncbi:hypothetical protein QYM36_000581 [Artemia franciscana]|uniref:Alpha-1,3-glucosyltransferase n=1 Tax=Artemia franciscana TaxID=6661 RepID=A0AA88LGN8_ARTSF|nr:hypothetical protein QYM36_000581 [Artemia franciscana]
MFKSLRYCKDEFTTCFSTDFQVHRNWLAITKSLPLEKWYYDNTSVWTLDYPPFFAWLEYILSQLAVVIDPEMVKLNNIDYKSEAAIIFQRSSVILLDFVYYYGAYLVCSSFMPVDTRTAKLSSTNVIAFILLASNPGLLMVDHIHFQYNGFLSGLLFISIAHIRQGNFLASAFWFAVLLNFKHIYLYVAPAYFVFLLVAYCGTEDLYNLVKRILHLGGIVLSVFAVSFAPFADHVLQVLSRLFPFQRGLCHAYWAPNLWAIYNVLDKALVTIGEDMLVPPKLNVTKASMTGGLVQQFEHTLLPDITPKTTFVLTSEVSRMKLASLYTSAFVVVFVYLYCYLIQHVRGAEIPEFRKFNVKPSFVFPNEESIGYVSLKDYDYLYYSTITKDIT